MDGTGIKRLGRAPLRISLAYAALAAAGAVLSDWLTLRHGVLPYTLAVAALKDCLFVAGTAVLLYLLIRLEVRVLHRAYEAVERERVFGQALVQSLAEGIVATDAEARCTVVNQAARDVLPDPERLVSGELELAHPDGRPVPPEEAPIRRAMRGESVRGQELVLKLPGGTPRTLLFSASPIRLGKEGLGTVAAFLDVTESRRFAHQAVHDALTGLPNRTLFLDRLDRALAALPRRPKRLAVIYLDLDGFKPVNDRLGHAAGDELLRLVATRLPQCLRSGDTLARLGGDEFAVLLPELGQPQEAAAVAARVVAALEQPFPVEGQEVRISGSLGVVLTEGGVSLMDLMVQADGAMYEAKRQGRGRYVMVGAQP